MRSTEYIAWVRIVTLGEKISNRRLRRSVKFDNHYWWDIDAKMRRDASEDY